MQGGGSGTPYGGHLRILEMPVWSARGEASPVPDERWLSRMSEGNAAFATGDWARARTHYGEALAEAESLMVEADLGRTTTEPCTAPALFTIACHNLAEVARREGHANEASELVSRAFERLLEVAGSSAAPLALRTSCIRHLKPALAEVSADLSERRLADRIATAIDRARRALEAVSRAVHDHPAAS